MSSFLGKISEKYICLSSQVDVYRNLKKFPFKYSLSSNEEVQIYNDICSEFYKFPYSDRFTFKRLMSKEDVIECFEDGIIYNDNTIYGENSYVAKRDDGLSFVKINCKEHLELTGKIPGVNFFRSSHFAYEIESDLDEKIKFAFNTKYGYVFQDLSIVGNGLKLSCLLHLPALKYYKNIDFIKENTKNLKMKFSLLESDICDDFYTIETILNNGDEMSFIRNMDKYVSEIVNLEFESRRKLLGIKTDYYRSKFEKYKNILSKEEDISLYILSKYVSLCFLLQSLELIMDYDFKFLYHNLMKLRASCFFDEDTKKERLIQIAKSLV